MTIPFPSTATFREQVDAAERPVPLELSGAATGGPYDGHRPGRRTAMCSPHLRDVRDSRVGWIRGMLPIRSYFQHWLSTLHVHHTAFRTLPNDQEGLDHLIRST